MEWLVMLLSPGSESPARRRQFKWLVVAVIVGGAAAALLGAILYLSNGLSFRGFD
jgi:hypothetical protein